MLHEGNHPKGCDCGPGVSTELRPSSRIQHSSAKHDLQPVHDAVLSYAKHSNANIICSQYTMKVVHDASLQPSDVCMSDVIAWAL